MGKKKAFDFRAENVFLVIDTDQSGTLERDEIKVYLSLALGDL